ncbi:hypothetical protein CR513_36541, partial [Mucuna pruriens]
MSSGDELRRHSAGIASSGNNEKKVVVPRYLRASTGSCHDFCKYGRQNVQEAKEKLSVIKRVGRKSLCRSSEDSIGGTMTLVAKQKALVDSKLTKMSAVKHSESPVATKLKISDTSCTNKVELSTKSSGSQKQIGNKVVMNTSKASSVRAKPSFVTKSHISSIPETRRWGISSSFEVETPPKATSKMVENSPTATSERVKTYPKPTSRMVKTLSKVSSFEDKEMLSEKHVTSLNPDFITMQTISSMKYSEGFGGQRNSKIKMNKREASSKPSGRNIASVSARKYKGLKIVSRLMNQPKPIELELEEHNNEVQEKTLYVIKMESAKQTLQSDQNESQDIEFLLSDFLSSPKFSSPSKSQPCSQEDQEESEYATNEFEKDASPGKHEIEYMANVDTWEAEENGKPQKDVIVFFEDKECQKLRGNLIETEIEKGSLNSLKFQRGKVLGDDAIEVMAGAITGREKVVLKHQDVQVKKDGQGLYNNMIKETANKLVQIQKSKVKALVGAFETVISLEEKRNSANIENKSKLVAVNVSQQADGSAESTVHMFRGKYPVSSQSLC